MTGHQAFLILTPEKKEAMSGFVDLGKSILETAKTNPQLPFQSGSAPRRATITTRKLSKKKIN